MFPLRFRVKTFNMKNTSEFSNRTLVFSDQKVLNLIFIIFLALFNQKQKQSTSLHLQNADSFKLLKLNESR